MSHDHGSEPTASDCADYLDRIGRDALYEPGEADD